MKNFKNPFASSENKATLSLEIKQFDEENDKNHIFEMVNGDIYRIHNRKIFRKGAFNLAF